MTERFAASAEVRRALDRKAPVVALESTVICHGLPYPKNLDVARRMETLVRENGAVPATIAVLGGRVRVGLTDLELEHLATATGIRKVSGRDLAIVVAMGMNGATTVAATAIIAQWAAIRVFATGGIGGVHRNAPFDISNDLPTLASTEVAVVCSGAKSILDLKATLEWLETAGVPVVGYQTDEFPAFYSRRSGLRVDLRVETPGQAASIFAAAQRLRTRRGMVIAVPVPAEFELAAADVEAEVAQALAAAQEAQIQGSATTPFLLRYLASQTHGASLLANVALLERNATVAAQIAVALGVGGRIP